CRIRRVSAGVITTIAGNGVCGYSGDGISPTSAQLGYPSGVAVDTLGNLYISDANNQRVRKISGGLISTFAGNGTFGYSGDGGPATSTQLNYPQDVTIDSLGSVYIADSNNCRIRKVSGGVISTVAGNGSCGYSGDGALATGTQLSNTTGVTVDPAG